ncbi:MAG: hypothetical protein WCQ50_17625, partial [Spirochaetota bacterium]
SRHITDLIDSGDLSEKPGWVRVSIHPTMTDAEARHVGSSVVEVIRNYREWAQDYEFDRESGEFLARRPSAPGPGLMEGFEALPAFEAGRR